MCFHIPKPAHLKKKAQVTKDTCANKPNIIFAPRVSKTYRCVDYSLQSHFLKNNYIFHYKEKRDDNQDFFRVPFRPLSRN